MTTKELREEVNHRIQNYKFFGYDTKPTREQVAHDLVMSGEAIQ